MENLRIRQQQRATRQTGKYILYWMQQAQRSCSNPALSYALEQADKAALPLVVIFVFTDKVPEANLRHYKFMIQGLVETANSLQQKGISMFFALGEPPEVIVSLAAEALEVVADHGYLHFQRNWREKLQGLLSETGTAYTEIETEPLIPVSLVSLKEEYSAATLRRKYLRLLENWSLDESFPDYHNPALPQLKSDFPLLAASNITANDLLQWVFRYIQIDSSVPSLSIVQGGARIANKKLQNFLSNNLTIYNSKRNEPSLDVPSGLSPYLHFGQISAKEITKQLMSKYSLSISQLSRMIGKKAFLEPAQANVAAFAEELLIRRELSFNFCNYNASYDNFGCLPLWARNTLLDHLADIRTEQYSLDRLLQCATSDVYWNTAQKEMMETGKMHNYMRMYWGKRLISWFDSPEDAYQVLLYLNNRYALDGRDANSYAGVAWCFGKHDRPWQSRKIYGSVRYMNAAGLERKFYMEGYIRKVDCRKGE